MLCKIDQGSINDAQRILTLLCFAPRPLTLRELIDGIAVEINEPVGFNDDCRFEDYNDIRDICPGLVDINVTADQTTEPYDYENSSLTVRITHFSVQEYLESERIRTQKAAIFGLNDVTAHTEIAQICLIYLLNPGLSSSNLDQSLLKEFPLAHFAAMYWYYHYQNVANHVPRLEDFVLKLLQHQDSFATWVKLHDVDQPWDTTVNFDRMLGNIPAPIYYASLLGLDRALHGLNNGEQPESTNTSFIARIHNQRLLDVNAQGGRYGNALQAASLRGHKEVVQMLVDKGADVNAQGGRYSNALQAASEGGHKEVVQMLVDKRADINAQGGFYGNALQAASLRGYKEVVQMLVNKGADINAQGGFYSNALQAASLRGHKEVVQMLVDKGADINAQDGFYGNALQAASKGGNKEVVQMLVDKGADINAQGGEYGNALQAASLRGHKEVVQMLVNKGADINAQGGRYGNALQAASKGGHKEVVQILVDKGADINA